MFNITNLILHLYYCSCFILSLCLTELLTDIYLAIPFCLTIGHSILKEGNFGSVLHLRYPHPRTPTRPHTHIYTHNIHTHTPCTFLDWNCYRCPLCQIFLAGLFYREGQGFSTDCSCGVWCRRLSTCLLYVSPSFGKIVLNDSWFVSLTWYNTHFSLSLFCV